MTGRDVRLSPWQAICMCMHACVCMLAGEDQAQVKARMERLKQSNIGAILDCECTMGMCSLCEGVGVYLTNINLTKYAMGMCPMCEGVGV